MLKASSHHLIKEALNDILLMHVVTISIIDKIINAKIELKPDMHIP